MIKKITVLSAISLLFTACYQPERNCKDYETGTFKFFYEIDGVKKEGKFVRTKDYSIDYYENKIDSATIRWYNDCEYVLQDINSKTAIRYKIISTTDSTYTFQYQSAVKDPNKELIVKQEPHLKPTNHVRNFYESRRLGCTVDTNLFRNNTRYR